ncbi:MAG: hypothetical protein LBU45_06535 [Azoarcus sp.]|nr:hypothetical protein [Azoarcus sp.]
MKKLALLALTALSSASAMAQTPATLSDNNATTADPAQWKTAASIMQSALECRQRINPTDPALRPLLPKNETNQWALIPPKGFSVFGLPVQLISIYIDPTGELGASYTASVTASKAVAAKAAQLSGQRKTGSGSVRIDRGRRALLTGITCTVDN